MLYEFKLSHSAAEAARNMALAFGSDSPSETTVRCWFAKISSGNFDLEDIPGRGQRMSLDDQALRAAVETKPGSKTTVRCWFAKFSSGDFDLEDKPGRGRRVSLNDQALRAAVETKPDTTTYLNMLQGHGHLTIPTTDKKKS
ncbi:hypothetical protein Y032_0108g49 [Ancylostoma ceylanicum]|nr:hypothetical protein Y032_0108g49 [Ancylostoma ceylanicum]